MLQSMGSQGVRHDLATEEQQPLLSGPQRTEQVMGSHGRVRGVWVLPGKASCSSTLDTISCLTDEISTVQAHFTSGCVCCRHDQEEKNLQHLEAKTFCYRALLGSQTFKQRSFPSIFLVVSLVPGCLTAVVSGDASRIDYQ